VDLKIVHGMRAMLTATHVLDGSYTVNPMYNATRSSLTSDRMEIPESQLEPWENWFWTLGPAIRALLGVAAVPELSEEIRGASESAVRMGRATTHRIATDLSHPAFGIPITRFDTDREGRDYEAKYSPSDALFLASWGWLPLYKATGDASFLRATRDLVRAAERLIELFETPDGLGHGRADGCLQDGAWRGLSGEGTTDGGAHARASAVRRMLGCHFHG